MHNWWRIRALGFHQKIQERRNNHQQEDHNWFCIKYYVISFPRKINNRALLTKSKIHMFKISLYKIYRFHFSSKYKSHILYQIFHLRKASNIAKFKFKTLSVTSYINFSQPAVTPKQTDVHHRQVFSHMVLCN